MCNLDLTGNAVPKPYRVVTSRPNDLHEFEIKGFKTSLNQQNNSVCSWFNGLHSLKNDWLHLYASSAMFQTYHGNNKLKNGASLSRQKTNVDASQRSCYAEERWKSCGPLPWFLVRVEVWEDMMVDSSLLSSFTDCTLGWDFMYLHMKYT